MVLTTSWFHDDMVLVILCWVVSTNHRSHGVSYPLLSGQYKPQVTWC